MVFASKAHKCFPRRAPSGVDLRQLAMSRTILRNAKIFRGDSCQLESGDVEIKGRRIGRIAPAGELATEAGAVELDVAGAFVSAGWIDVHVHVFEGIGVFSLPPRDVGTRRGVTTMADTGTAGALTYAAFEKFVSRRSAERVFAFLNVSLIGAMHGYPTVVPIMGELCDIRYVDIPAMLAAATKFPEHLVGFKVRLTDVLADYLEENERAGLMAAARASGDTGLPFMVHHHTSSLSADEVLGTMRSGDILTHLYNPSHSRPFDPLNRPLDALLEARQRGVLFDVGHGIGSFAWDVAETVCRVHQFWPDTISTDMHTFCINGPVFDLATTLTKFLYLGMPIESVIASCTVRPAGALGKQHLVGVLEEGREADLTVFRMEAGDWPLYDVYGDVRRVTERIRPEMTFRAGQMFRCAAPAPVDLQEMELVATR